MKISKLIIPQKVKGISVFLLLGAVLACSNDETSETFLDDANALETSELISNRESCTEVGPSRLGPGTTRVQSCSDPSNAFNIGTLDCRSRGAGGYSQSRIGSRNFGIYKLRGGPERYDGTRTRVERSFRNIENAKNSFMTFRALFTITDLGDRATHITQMHAGNNNKILFGSRVGQLARSAIMALSAEKTSNPNKFKLSVSQTIVPFTSNLRGTRIDKHFRNITKGVLYRLTVKTGYDKNRRAVTTYTVARVSDTSDKRRMVVNHTFTTQKMSLRYGAYETADKGDVGAEIRFANTELCRTN